MRETETALTANMVDARVDVRSRARLGDRDVFFEESRLATCPSRDAFERAGGRASTSHSTTPCARARARAFARVL